MTPTLTSLLLRLGSRSRWLTRPSHAASRRPDRRTKKAEGNPCAQHLLYCGLCDACWISRPYSSCWCCWSYSRSSARCHQKPLSLNTLHDAILLATHTRYSPRSQAALATGAAPPPARCRFPRRPLPRGLPRYRPCGVGGGRRREGEGSGWPGELRCGECRKMG